MPVFNRIFQSASLCSHLPGYLSFTRALKDPEAAQRKILASYFNLFQLPYSSYEDFAQKQPATDYTHWADQIETARKSKTAKPGPLECVRYEPTSGSTHRRKWIPYTRQLLREFNHAASPWLVDLAFKYPKILSGGHYWSLSWLPDELREEMSSVNDTAIFPKWKRFMIDQVMSVPCEVSLLPSSEQAMLATLAYLAADPNLRLISAWSPTFVIELVRGISNSREQLAEILRTGKWQLPGIPAPKNPARAALLSRWDGKLDPKFFAELWPELSLLSAWESSTSAEWAKDVKTLFPQVPFQGKGLWATEGVVSIPFRDQHVLAVTSHFLEFRCLETQKILPAWSLEKGQRVQPLLSTGSGLFRYALDDQLWVEGFEEKTPCLKFLGRLKGVDLVGEKIDPELAHTILQDLSRELPIRCLSLLAQAAKNPSRPRYVLLAQARNPEDKALQQKISTSLEAALMKLHHYRLARELGQLEHATVLLKEDALGFYQSIRSQKEEGIRGARKIEPITLWMEA